MIQRDSKGQLIKYAWPGGYPVFYLDGENSVLCHDCAVKSDSEDEIPQFKPVASDINYEDASLYCDQCSQRIESAYAEDEAS